MEERADLVRAAGTTKGDLRDQDASVGATIAGAVGVPEDAVFLEARDLGRHGQLFPRWPIPESSSCSFRFAISPRSRARSPASTHEEAPRHGRLLLHCRFGRLDPGPVLRTRGGILEDPATGSAAASLGVYLADRIGPIDFELIQGVEMGRESHIHVEAEEGRVRVGGTCALVFEGEISALP